MQNLIAKYGAAVHLAILAASPLFLLPFITPAEVAGAILWLCLPAAIWLFNEPSVRAGEFLHDARRRVLRHTYRDPLTWVMLAVVLFCALRALNGGIALAYDAEYSEWFVKEAACAIFPGVVGDAGDLEFCVALAGTLVVIGCRNALGSSARAAFLLVMTALTGLSAAIVVFCAFLEGEASLMALVNKVGDAPQLGLSYGLCLLAATVTLVSCFEQKWNGAALMFPFAIGGNAAGLLIFSPLYVTAGILAMWILLAGYSFFYSSKQLKASGEFKALVVMVVSLALGGLMVVAIMPEKWVDGLWERILNQEYFPFKYWEKRAVLTAIAMKSFLAHIWAGTGMDSFRLDFRFSADEAAWQLFPQGTSYLSNGWLQMLVERGIVGTVFFALPIGFLIYIWGRRLTLTYLSKTFLTHPATWLSLAAAVAIGAAGAYDCAFMRPDAIMVTWALLAIAGASFKHGSRRS